MQKKISKRFEGLNKHIDKKTEKVLNELKSYEAKLSKEISKKDSSAASNYFRNTEIRYNQFLNQFKQKSDNYSVRLSGEYLAWLDSIKGSLSFLQQNSYANTFTELQKSQEVSQALNEIKQFESRLMLSEEIKQFIKQRKQQIKSIINNYTSIPGSISRKYKNISKSAYYYSAQIRDYRDMLRRPEKLEKAALTVLNRLPAFRQFMKENSQLAKLFGISGTTSITSNATGFPTRQQIVSYIQNQPGMGGLNAEALIQQNLQSAQSRVSEVRNEMNVFGKGGMDPDMPDFKPKNHQKTKTFLRGWNTELRSAILKEILFIRTQLISDYRLVTV